MILSGLFIVPKLRISPTMLKYINKSTNKSLEKYESNAIIVSGNDKMLKVCQYSTLTFFIGFLLGCHVNIIFTPLYN